MTLLLFVWITVPKTQYYFSPSEPPCKRYDTTSCRLNQSPWHDMCSFLSSGNLCPQYMILLLVVWITFPKTRYNSSLSKSFCLYHFHQFETRYYFSSSESLSLRHATTSRCLNYFHQFETRYYFSSSESLFLRHDTTSHRLNRCPQGRKGTTSCRLNRCPQEMILLVVWITVPRTLPLTMRITIHKTWNF